MQFILTNDFYNAYPGRSAAVAPACKVVYSNHHVEMLMIQFVTLGLEKLFYKLVFAKDTYVWIALIKKPR